MACFILNVGSDMVKIGKIGLLDTKGSSKILVLHEEDVAYFIPSKCIKEKTDKNGNVYYSFFLNDDWEYSSPKSHFDEETGKWVKEPIQYVKGRYVISDLEKYAWCSKKLPPKEETPF